MILSIHAVGWTLVHFVWQGAVLALATTAVFRALRSASPQTRYLVACGALVLMLGAPLMTWLSFNAERAPIASHAQPVSFGAANTLPPFPMTAPPRFDGSVRVVHRGVEWLLPLIVGGWLVGVALLMVRLAGGWWHVRRVHRQALAMASSSWQAMSDRTARHLQVPHRVHVVDSDLVDTPTALGWIRPVILLPIAACANLTPEQVEAILAHELAHVRRHDYLVNLLQAVTETVLFYHPAVWWVSGRIRAEREHCCDDVAVEVCGDAVSYATALESIERTRHAPIGPRAPATFALAATTGSLLTRVRRILRMPADQERSSLSAVLTMVLVIALIGVMTERQHLKALSQPSSATAQSPAADPIDARFEVASIKSVNNWTPQGRGFMCAFGPGRPPNTFKGFGKALWLITCAYEIPAPRAWEQVVGAPAWLGVDIFEVNATAPPDRAPRSFSDGLVMVRALLADRFKLLVHRETKEQHTFALVLARPDGKLGPQLRPTPRDCAAWIAAGRKGPQPSTPGYRACGFARTTASTVTNTAMTMQKLADYLSGRTGRVVRDLTGLSADFDLDLHLDLPVTPPPIAPELSDQLAAALAQALRDQLGLTLESRTDSVDLLVIDHVEHPVTN